MTTPDSTIDTPKYTLYCADCLDVMRGMDAGSVDAVITDPPYGVGINKSNRLSISRGFGDDTWDDERALPEVSELYVSFIQSNLIIWGGQYYTDILPPVRGWLVWDKLNDGRDFGECELAWTNLDQVIRQYKKRPIGMDGGKVHPTQKPIELMKWCIEMATNPGDTVFDPFLGSGTTGVACMQLGRKFIGVEIDPAYFDIAALRIAQAAMQEPLFTV